MFPPLSEQNCSNCRYSRTGWPGDLYCHRNPPQIGPRGDQPGDQSSLFDLEAA
jgi:hypothetical protein